MEKLVWPRVSFSRKFNRRKAEGLANFGEILVFICETLKQKEANFARAAMVIESIQSLLPSTRLIFLFLNWKSRFR